jgi:hypothetical protein
MLKTTCATIALLALSVTLADPALAAGCASPAEAAALKTAVMQQELMVAALQCHEASGAAASMARPAMTPSRPRRPICRRWNRRATPTPSAPTPMPCSRRRWPIAAA